MTYKGWTIGTGGVWVTSQMCCLQTLKWWSISDWNNGYNSTSKIETTVQYCLWYVCELCPMGFLKPTSPHNMAT